MRKGHYGLSREVAAFAVDLRIIREVFGGHEPSIPGGPAATSDVGDNGEHACALDLTKADLRAASLMPTNRWFGIGRFTVDLTKIEPLLKQISVNSKLSIQSTSVDHENSPVLDANDLRKIDVLLKNAKKNIFDRAATYKARLISEWPESPLICEASVLNPLSQRYSEVLLTRAMAWLITPDADSAPLRCAFLARTLALILDREVLPGDVSGWKVRAEETICVDKNTGRIDIFLEGYIGSQPHLIAIEAKINAPEGKRQLDIYSQALKKRAGDILSENPSVNRIVFLTPTGRLSQSSAQIFPISYAQLLSSWLPALKIYSDDPAALFARLLLADIARDLADMHLGDRLSARRDRLPRCPAENIDHKGDNYG